MQHYARNYQYCPYFYSHYTDRWQECPGGLSWSIDVMGQAQPSVLYQTTQLNAECQCLIVAANPECHFLAFLLEEPIKFLE